MPDTPTTLAAELRALADRVDALDTGPPPPPATVRHGYNARPTPAALEATHGRPDVWRHFNAGAPDPKVWDVGLPVIDSFKYPPADFAAGRHDAAVRAYLRAKPAALQAWVCLFHEPEDNVQAGQFTAAQWRAAQDHLYELCREVPNALATPILMEWTLNPASRRNPDDFTKGFRCDAIGWDIYATSPTQDMSAQLARVIARSTAVGKPWVVAETGLPKQADDAKRAAWMRTWAAQLDAASPRPDAVTWFITDMADPSPDYSLTSATQAVMRDLTGR